MNIVWKTTKCKGIPSIRSECNHSIPTYALTPRLRIYQGGIHRLIWRIGPAIRQCCIDADDPRALVSWWTEVELRFTELELIGLEDLDLAAGILQAKDSILELLQDRVPWPSNRAWKTIGTDVRRRSSPLLNRFLKPFGLTWPCEVEQLKTAWRRTALELHPDREGDAARFAAASDCYQRALRILSQQHG